MPNVKDLLRKIESGDISYEEKLAALSQVEASLQEMKAKKEERVKFNVQLIIDEIKKIKQDVQAQLDYACSIIPERGPKGDQGERGLDGAPGRDGVDGRNGRDGKDGKDGKDGVSVTDAKIDFDGSLIITLSTGHEINVGEVVSPDLAEKIKVTMSTNSSLTVSDEGSVLTSAVRKINFVGATVTASNAGDDVTVNVSAGTGSVTSVAMTTPTGLSVSGSPITTTGTLALSMTAGYSIPTTASQTNWDSAYSERRQWDGGSTNLVASTGRTSLGATTLGSNLFTITDPGAITFPRFNADNTVSALSASSFRTAIGAGTGDGTVTSVGATSPVASSGGATPTISLSSGYGDTQNPYASKTANFFLAAPNGSAGAPTFRAIVAADVPTLNQNTTGTASNVTGTVAVANGGTGQTSYTDGQLLIGNSTGNTLAKATLTQGSGITITNGSGSITIANASPMTYPGAGIPNSTGTAWGTSYSTTGSGTVVALATSPSFTTPSLGVATATTINKVTFTAPATGSTLTIVDGKTLTVNNSITFSGTDATTMTLPTTNATLAGLAVAQTFTATQTFSQINFTVNTVTVSANAGTVPITHRLHTFTNSSAAAMTITLATASAVDGQMAIVRIFDFSAAAQTINWVNTENSTVTVPTTSNGSTTLPLTVGFMYNNATSKWRCVASA